MDIWAENKRTGSDTDDPEPTFKTRETDINADEDSDIQEKRSVVRSYAPNTNSANMNFEPNHSSLK